ncbi:cation-transporting ATPase I [Geodermatophilus bullaregiensis]|uniref:cation-translocating P-type ATPase n=1 Tax=Geodermatophilus bullaregiensis TaxID=1564160 RepID=UPI001EF9168A|nr:cation-translocating P-type ATPase [Geodermatophilus bullaregiensis]MBM7808923.1 cation-transporting ATPase I [Geodermatophilus bullaregiensis]
MAMTLLPRYGVARAALTVTARVAVTGASLAAVPALVTADLLGASTRTSARAVRAAAGLTDRSVDRARTAAVSGVRAVGTLVTGADPLPTGRVRDLAVAARGLFEPPDQRRTPRTWADSGFVQVEVPEPAPDAPPDAGRVLRERLERLEGVRWAAVNEVVGRVLVAVDQRRVGVDDVVETVGALHRTAAGDDGLPEREDHPADLEPVLAALASAAVDLLAVGVAAAGRALPVPPLSRHVTLALPLLDSQDWLTRALTRRIGGVGTGLAFDGLSALLHSLTQSPTVPALNAIGSVQQALEARARRQVWRRREEDLCRPRPGDRVGGPVSDDGGRPVPLPPGTVERYTARLGPATTAVALLVLALTRRPGRSADLVKALSPKAALQGRESFAATLDLLMCRSGVVPMDGSVYRRLDRVDCVVVDGAALCTGPPVVLEATSEGEAGGQDWDDARVWTAASRLLDGDAGADGGRGPDGTRLGPPRETPEAPGAQVRTLLHGRRRVGTVVVARELDPHAEALLGAAGSAGHLVVLTAHAGARDVAGMAGQVAPADEPLARTVRRLQGEGHGVLLVTATDAAALLAADVGVAPVGPEHSPAWGADLLTGPGLAPVCRVVSATADARAVSRRSVQGAVTANVLGALLAAVGSALYGQRKATTPGKTATLVAIADGAWTAVRVARRPDPAVSVHTPWHALDPDDVLRRLAALPDAPGPRSRRRVPGAALLRGPLRFGRTVAAELADPLTPVLGAGAGATAVLGESADAILVGSVTVGNALLGALQRMRAETALESLLLEQDVLAHRETDGGLEEVPAGQLRVGDVVAVSSGDVVAADARLLEVADLEVDESSLTGESLAVAKSVAATPGAEVADRRCMLLDGTTVVAGTGRAVVVAVGTATQAGRAARAAGRAAPPAGVQARLAELTRSVLPLTLAGGTAVTALGVLWRRPLREAVGSGVAVAVAAVPEGLPLVATVAQQAAARRLSTRGAVVRSARVLEALGRVDTVCFDKTGTLTENRLQVVRLVPLAAGDSDGPADEELLRLAAAAVGAGDDEAHETDRAVVAAAADRGVAADGEAEASVPFATGRGFSAALRDGLLVVKGAPEVVLRRCTDPGDAARRVRELACEGLRVLAVADRAVEGRPDDLEAAADGLTLRGLVGLADTVRPSSAAAVEQLRAAGVRVLVATGDHPETAAAIAAQAGVPGADRVVTGAQLARASTAERARLVADAAVFARLSPEQKVLLVGALRRAGATLAMTGDGVNDAAAIRLADVGVGVAGAESPAARSAADLVVTDCDLTRLVDAVAEGRALWSRVRDAVAILVGGNAGEVAFTVLGTAFGGRAPLGTRQLLLVNLLTDMFPALAVAVAAPRAAAPSSDGGPLAGHPLEAVLLAGPQRGFTASVRELVAVRGVATAAGATGAWATGRPTGPRRAGTMGLAALIATQLGQTAWSGRRSPLVLATAAGSLLALVAVVQTPGVSRFFGCTPLDPLSWLVVLAWAAAGTAGAEVLPRVLKRAAGNRGTASGPG